MKYSYNRLILEGFTYKGGFMNPPLAGPLVFVVKAITITLVAVFAPNTD